MWHNSNNRNNILITPELSFDVEVTSVIAIVVFIGPTLGLIAFLIGMKLTGMERRNYSVCKTSDIVNGKKVMEIVEKYKPIIYQTENIKKDIQLLFYELVEQKEKIVLIYRPVWDDEIHPNPIIHSLYKYFRWIFYGSVKDIEFIEIYIDKKTGEVEAFNYETLAEGSTIEAPSHEFTEIERKGEKYYNKTKDIELSYSPFEGWRCILQVKTWNHLLSITEKPEGKKYDLPVMPLTNWQFRKYSISRRSAGYVRTKSKKWVKYFVSFASLIVFGIGFPLLLYLLLI